MVYVFCFHVDLNKYIYELKYLILGMNYSLFNFFIIVFCCCFYCVSGRTDSIINRDSTKKGKQFLTEKIILGESSSIIPKNSLAFFIERRFGTLSGKSNEHSFLGLDELNDYRIGVYYGVFNNLQVGLGRSKINELVEGDLKYRLLEQKNEGRNFCSVVVFLSSGVSTISSDKIYPLGTVVENRNNFAHRIKYLSKVVVSRQFSDVFYFQLVSGYQYRNLIFDSINPSNNRKETNGLPFVGFGGNILLKKGVCFLMEYFYIISAYRKNNPKYTFSNPLSIGFQYTKENFTTSINLSNAASVSGLNFLTGNNGRWDKGNVNIGLSVIRRFRL